MNFVNSSKPEYRTVVAGRAAIFMTLVCGACATAPPSGVAPLLNEARQNEIAAYAKNRDRSLRAVGIVLQTGMDSYNRVVADGFAYGWAVSVSAREEVEHYPYAIVGDEQTPSPDIIKCLFSTDDADLVGKLRPGMKISFEGRFHEYVHDQGRLILVLSTCSLD
jgi:hypothetical protein